MVFIIIILVTAVIAQLARVVELAQILRGGNNELATEKDNKNNGIMYVIFIVLFGISVVWQIVKWSDFLLPESASEHGVDIDWLMNVNYVLIFIPFIIVHIILAMFAYKYAGKKDTKATFFAHDNKLEMIWTIIPAAVLSFIISYGLKTWNEITAEAPKDAIVIELYAKQFDWTARYAGKDNKLGEANYRLIEGVNELGVNMNDGSSGDDFTAKGELHIPLGRTVLFKFRSRDVIHSAYMPHFRTQMNCVPGMVTQFKMKPIITSKEMRAKLKNEKFDYILLCNKICGTAHYNMQMNIIVDTPSEYEAWLKNQQPLSVALAPSSAASELKAEEVALTTDSAKVAQVIIKE